MNNSPGERLRMAHEHFTNFSLQTIVHFCESIAYLAVDIFSPTTNEQGWYNLAILIRWSLRLKVLADGVVISPAQKNPKKQVVHAAQSIMMSKRLASFCHTFLNLSSSSGVMGRQVCWAPPSLLSTEHTLRMVCCSIWHAIWKVWIRVA